MPSADRGNSLPTAVPISIPRLPRQLLPGVWRELPSSGASVSTVIPSLSRDLLPDVRRAHPSRGEPTAAVIPSLSRDLPPVIRLELPSRGERPLPSSRACRGTSCRAFGGNSLRAPLRPLPSSRACRVISCRAFGGHTLRTRQYYYTQPKRNKPLTQPRGTGSAARFLTAPTPFAPKQPQAHGINVRRADAFFCALLAKRRKNVERLTVAWSERSVAHETLRSPTDGYCHPAARLNLAAHASNAPARKTRSQG